MALAKTCFDQVTFATQFTYLFAVSLIKISILLFYKRIFITRRFAISVNIVGAFLVVLSITFLVWHVGQDWPISYNWFPQQPATSIDEFAMYIAAASIELLLDVITLIMPLTVIWTLHLDTSRKWIVSGIFMLGGL